MAERFINNYKGGEQYGHSKVWNLVEALYVFGYEFVSGDAVWTDVAKVIVNDTGTPGFAVDASEPLIITDLDVTGRFTSDMDADGITDRYSISLLGSEDQNRSIWKIHEYIDAHHIKVDPEGYNPAGWVTETTIPGRITKPGTMPNDSEILLNAPSPSRLQIRLWFKDYDEVFLYARPMGQDLVLTGYEAEEGFNLSGPVANTMTFTMAPGVFNKHMLGVNVTFANMSNAANDGIFAITDVDPTTGAIEFTNASGVAESFTDTDQATIAGVVTETDATASFANSGDVWNTYQGYCLDGNFIFAGINEDQNLAIAMGGELDDTAIEDTSPGFVCAMFGDVNFGRWYIRMLNGADSPASILAYMGCIVKDDTKYNDDEGIDFQPGNLLCNDGAFLLRPQVILANTVTVGACRRGIIPDIVRMTNAHFEIRRPMNSTNKLWMHLKDRVCIPRPNVDSILPKAGL